MTYDGSGQDERVSAGGTKFQYGMTGLELSGAGLLLGDTAFTRDPEGNLVSQRTGNGSYYYLFDGLGSVVALTDASGAVVNRYAYDPYGNPIASATTEAVANPWRFAGGYYDRADNTGLYKFGTRYYDPATGRWTQPDPSGQEANGYAYVGDNPVNLVDPSGLGFCPLGRHKGGGCIGGSINSRRFVEGQVYGYITGALVTTTCGAFVIGFTGGIGTAGTVGCVALGRAANFASSRYVQSHDK
jgi:RHS repeat-associated protein